MSKSIPKNTLGIIALVTKKTTLFESFTYTRLFCLTEQLQLRIKYTTSHSSLFATETLA